MLLPLIKTMRPKQWTKNVFFFAALVFDAKLFDPAFALPAIAGFLLCASLLAPSICSTIWSTSRRTSYTRSSDSGQLPSGQLPRRAALTALILFVLVGQPLGFLLDPAFGIVLSSYLLLQLFYSFVLKNIVLIDVLTIAAGFVLRVGAGVALVEVERFSPWLYVCMTLLALFMGFGKRRHELQLLKEDANNHRAILNEYTLSLLDQIMTVVVAATIIAYALYTFSAEGLPDNHVMMLTIPFVLYGLFRYLYLIHVRGQGGAPEEILLGDTPFLINCCLWGASILLIFYFL